MKKVLSILLLSLALTSYSQVASTNTAALPATPLLGGEITNLWNFLGASSNLIVAPYGIIAEDGKKFGGGIGLGFRVSELVVPTARLEYYDGGIWMPHTTMQLQLPVYLNRTKDLVLFPFGFAGVAVPLSGKGDDNGDPVGTLGIGMALRLGKWGGVLADWEHWTGFDSDQIRIGTYFRF